MMQSGMVKTDHYHLEGNEDVVCAEPVPVLPFLFLSFSLYFPFCISLLSAFPSLPWLSVCLAVPWTLAGETGLCLRSPTDDKRRILYSLYRRCKVRVSDLLKEPLCHSGSWSERRNSKGSLDPIPIGSLYWLKELIMLVSLLHPCRHNQCCGWNT